MSLRLVAITVLMVLAASSNAAFAQDSQQQIVLTETVDGSFGAAWEAVKRVMTEFRCEKPQQEKVIEPAEVDGFYKGLYVSDYCILKTGEDSTAKVMEQYGKLPRIRQGIWISGRIQFKINVREEERGKTKVVLKAELSGFEEFITNAVHFWTSNGILEQRAMDLIKKYTLEEAQKKAADE
ncbi:MAG: hypothetical protein FGM24_03885 [Candidatus Kapabacteria bacterium]|nr:hypothetical protein [Candidatus Kapabacteria bacterium]